MSADEDVPRRVLEAEARRKFREQLSDSSLGCPMRKDQGRCEHMIGDHIADYWDSNGDPVNPRCTVWGCPCGTPNAGRRF